MGSGVVGVANGVACPVDPRGLAEPQPHDAVIAPFAMTLGQLATHDGGGGELLVESWAEDKREVSSDQLLGDLQLAVEAGQRRARVPRGKCCGAQTVGPVDPQLLHHDPRHSLDAGREHRACAGGDPVGEGVRRLTAEGHQSRGGSSVGHGASISSWGDSANATGVVIDRCSGDS